MGVDIFGLPQHVVENVLRVAFCSIDAPMICGPLRHRLSNLSRGATLILPLFPQLKTRCHFHIYSISSFLRRSSLVAHHAGVRGARRCPHPRFRR